jgi:DNA-binding MarR family transcriptional regulator
LPTQTATTDDVTDERQLAGELVTVLASIRRAGRRYTRRPAELSALTGAQLELARLVRRSPGISIAHAAEELRLAPNTVSTVVGELTAAGLLVRSVDAADRRVANLTLSPSFGRKIDAWRDRRATAIGEAISRLPAADRRLLEHTLPVLAEIADLLEDVGAGT